MNPSDAIREAASASGFTFARLAAVMGTIPHGFNVYLTRKNVMRADNLVDMAGAMVYDVFLVPNGARRPNGSITVDEGCSDD